MKEHTSLLPLLLLGFVVSSTTARAQTNPPSLAEIKTAAEGGDPVAQDKLGDAYASRVDAKQAELWYRKAAEQGDPSAQGHLGHLLLATAENSLQGTKVSRAAVGKEATEWLVLAADAGNKAAQADLGRILLEGRVAKPDYVEAYKWGALAAQGMVPRAETIAGRACRDTAILKMTPAQIEEANKRVAAFVPHSPAKPSAPEPAWVRQIKLKGISGPPDHRLALINGRTLEKGEEAELKLRGKTVMVRCIEIRESSVVIWVPGLDGMRELQLSGD